MSDPNPPAEPAAERALVPLAPEDLSLVYDPTGRPAVYWCSWDLLSAADRRRMMRALSEPDVRPAVILNVPFPTQHVFMHPVTLTNPRDGEVKDQIRTVLIGPDGRTLSFCSGGVVRWVKWLVAIYGKPPWSPPMQIVVRQVELGDARRTYALDVVEEPEAPPAPKGKGGSRAP